ncbi:hypothetical protein LCGC14_0738470 [marine sediment metagenome]|uniref:Uncharacterized protein n=1 Tax=marine sediment metagenome TaxID=412755 RepID=A0A0F9SSD6_9ZZZZ
MSTKGDSSSGVPKKALMFVDSSIQLLVPLSNRVLTTGVTGYLVLCCTLLSSGTN